MSREIKFRAWNGSEMEMPNGNLSDYIEGMICRCGEGRLMQYAKIKDENGVEVYEGDIVMIEGSQLSVVNLEPNKSTRHGHGDCSFSIHLRVIGGYGQGDKFKVIGNVYKNPELLEKRR